MGSVVPFPKPEPRLRLSQHSWKRLRDKVAGGKRCVAGACSAQDAHHVFPRDLGGDDVEENLLPLCRLHHGIYTDRSRGWELVAKACRDALEHRHRLYLVKKLGGVEQARSFLDRHYPERATTEGGPPHAA